MNGIKVVCRVIGRVLRGGILLVMGATLLFVTLKGHQPMRVAAAPAGMTYFQFLGDRIEAAKIVQPSRCGWGMFLSLAVIGPLYSAVYTEVGVHPHGFLARVTAPDPDIPKEIENASWDQVPHIWWSVVERLSWTMLGKANPGCRFRPVEAPVFRERKGY